jgi:hypothetical protein
MLCEKSVTLNHPLSRVDLVSIRLEAGDREAALAALPEARTAMTQATGREREEMRREFALLLYRMGKNAEAEEIEKELQKEDRTELQIASIAVLHPPLKTAAEIKARLAAEDPGATRAARYAIAQAREHLTRDGSREAASELLVLAGELASVARRPDSHPQLLEIAKLAHQHGMKDMEERAEGVFLKLTRTASAESEWKPLHLAMAAEWLMEKGRPEEAQKLSSEAEVSVAKVFILEAPSTLLRLAALQLRLGNAAEAEALVIRAAEAGLAYPHPRARGQAATQVCLFYASRRQPIPQAVAQRLTAIREAHQD